ncbi:MAG: hypothetical protein MJK04_21785, partial [Psychrosphaera sp.]|nr:hypothetical protein [Psychrosphaera sp.]
QETAAQQIRAIQSNVATVSGSISVNTTVYFALLWLIFMLMLIYHAKKRPWQHIQALANDSSPEINSKQQKIVTLLLGLTLVLACTAWLVQNQWPVFAKEIIIQWSIQIVLMLSIPMGLATSLAYHIGKADQALKSLMAPAAFLGLLGFGMVGLTEQLYQLNIKHQSYGSPFEYVQVGRSLSDTVAATTEHKRQQAARVIYRQFAAKMHYKSDDGGFTLFEPNNEDAKVYSEARSYQQQKLDRWQQDKTAAKMTTYQLMTKLWIFSIVFWGGLFYWVRKRNAPYNKSV